MGRPYACLSRQSTVHKLHLLIHVPVKTVRNSPIYKLGNNTARVYDVSTNCKDRVEEAPKWARCAFGNSLHFRVVLHYSHNEDTAYVEGVREQGAKEDIWAKRDGVTEEWRRLHNKEPHDLYSSSNVIGVIRSRNMRWAGHVACMGDRRGAYRVLMGRPEGKITLVRYRLRWGDDIKMDLQDVGWGGMDWIDLAQDKDTRRAHVNEVMNLRGPQNAGNSWLAEDLLASKERLCSMELVS